jgi:hypothetical protein
MRPIAFGGIVLHGWVIGPPGKVTMQRSVVLIPIRTWLPLSVAAALGLSLFAAWAAFARPEPIFDAQCDSLDTVASRAVGDLVADRNIETEQRLGDALFRLRRARNHCRHGLVGLARLDYRALTDGRYSNYRRLGDYRNVSQR